MRLVICIAVTLLVWPAAAVESVGALLATLHRAQDRLVLDGAAVRPVHDRLLRLLDARVADPAAKASAAEIVRYALSGGDPRIARRALARTGTTPRDALLVRGTLAYLSGDASEARRLLALIDVRALRGRTAVLVTMAKAGAAARAGEGAEARRWLRRVRLEAPGTLMEEAALRRLAALALARDDVAFFRLARQYWTRFPRSLFAPRMRALATAALARFDGEAVLDHLPRLARAMPPVPRAELHAHAARAAVVDGHVELARMTLPAVGTTAPARLLRAVAGVSGKDARAVAARLGAFSPRPLAPRDRALLAAAREVAGRVTAPVEVAERGEAGALAARHGKTLGAVDRLLAPRARGLAVAR